MTSVINQDLVNEMLIKAAKRYKKTVAKCN